MDSDLLVLLAACIALAAVAGCTASPAVANATPGPVLPSPTLSPGGLMTPSAIQSCVTDEDCVPAQCCHPTSCINKVGKGVCNLMCTSDCTGPLDCGAGSCGCVNGACGIARAGSSAAPVPVPPSLKVEAAPLRYSPVMSSTPGLGLTPNLTGMDAAGTDVEWKTSFGRFLTWSPPDYQVREQGSSFVNHGEKVYWSFSDMPASTGVPVVITVIARDNRTGRVGGTSTVTLGWEGDSTVVVETVL